MGFLDIFKSQRDIVKEELHEIPWIQLEREEQVEEIKEVSRATPVLIFKHSVTCGISRMVLRNFEKAYDVDKKYMVPYFVDIKQNRKISDLIASHFGVRHESPQIIVIKKEECVYDASHGGITAADVKETLNVNN